MPSNAYTDEGDVTIYDRLTKQSRTVHWGPGYSLEFWWQDGNGSCDCNRALYFWEPEIEAGEVSADSVGGVCCCERYVITHVNGESVNFAEWNADWREEPCHGG